MNAALPVHKSIIYKSISDNMMTLKTNLYPF